MNIKLKDNDFTTREFKKDEEVYYPRIKRYGIITKCFDDRYYLNVGGTIWSVPEKALKHKKNTLK
jgi:hypothetical protein